MQGVFRDLGVYCLSQSNTLTITFFIRQPPYKLNDDDARLEAKTMIDNGQVWVHLVKMGGQEPQVACLVATTRESDAVTAVTKVITAEAWQLRRCARRLLHRVCQE